MWMLGQSDSQMAKLGTNRVDTYLRIHKLLFQEDEQHRWFTLGIRRMVENQITVFLGSASSGKTTLMAVMPLIDFFCFPHTSLSLISSTDKRSLELRVWGRVKELYNRAKSKFPWLPGYVLESAMAITPDDIDDDNEMARTINKGIVCVPCVSGGRFVGMSKFQGVKPPNSPGKLDGKLAHYGDEAALMQPSFLDAYTNWMVNQNFKGCMGGNPLDLAEPLCTAAEPIAGWDSFVDTEKTQEWKSKFYNAHVVAFDGRDNPNKDFPGTRYPFLISDKLLESVASTHGKDSWQWFSQCIGKPSKNMVSWRVITMTLCQKHKAFDDVVWKGTERTKLYAIDLAYGSGDRCVGMELQFGEDAYGQTVIDCSEPEIIPIRLNSSMEPEEQIAAFAKEKLDMLGIPSENCFYDSFGIGTIGHAFSKVFKDKSPIPVNAGGKPTDRPVRHDLFHEVKNEYGMIEKRLKKCSEHYSKFLTELWFSTREAIESEQVRNLPKEVAQEGQMRMYSIVAGNKIEIEKKEDMKERIKKSPDLMDTFAIGVEGARRLGFQITRIGIIDKSEDSTDNFMQAEMEEFENAIKSRLLVHD
jgi:hypothetical protein